MKEPFFLIAGPCVVEDENSPYEIAKKIYEITSRLGIPFIFKASYRKANRSKLNSFQGIGDEKALNVIKKIKDELGLLVTTDVHNITEVDVVAEYVDVLQIPAFLCRQTELLLAAGKTQKTVNVKKGQFLSPESMKFAVEKIESTGNKNIMLTERGTTFGYGDLVVDMRSIPIMQTAGYPVVLDVTHSLQQPNTLEGVTGGAPQFIETIAKAGIAVGANGIFIETHPDPAKALSDGKNMLPLNKLENLLQTLLRIHNAL
ncbi:3-deoxy-8-phosphooctulonate synthase [Bacteroidales bacterium OttesenSCG-928-K03]|nr:3-deoxy-8-phosphooctulonate synthase [Odoribacter sp. OttesenSCG-928-L07]MDL2240157.1 3-deoxy-8-phosphooctulonate synthase [Bacteroidales bacterium OttesenSCG-928-K22]MDL2243209.1 3-deoxy-8-phosphooctulonate synthase [Bacteroidales bacterium OttesenSCG-928-K03]